MESVRVLLPPGCRGLDLDGQRLDAVDGAVTVTGRRAAEFRRVADTLPGATWTGYGLVPLVRCLSCGHARERTATLRCACGGVCQ